MKRKKAGLLIVILLFLLLIAAVFIFARFRGAVVVHANKDVIPEQEVVFYRQDDERWAQETLGSSKYTMEGSGCLVCCIASAISMTGGEITPEVLNDKFFAQNVYDAEGNVVWNSLQNAGEYQAEVFGEISNGILEEYLKNGCYPIARVRMHGVGNFHYVLIVKAESGMFYCMDPLRDGLVPLSKYGNRIYAVRCVYPAGE